MNRTKGATSRNGASVAAELALLAAVTVKYVYSVLLVLPDKLLDDWVLRRQFLRLPIAQPLRRYQLRHRVRSRRS